MVTDSTMASTPLWQAGVSKSMQRAMAAGVGSQGTLVRPSVHIAIAAQERARELRNQRRAGMGNAPELKPAGWGRADSVFWHDHLCLHGRGAFVGARCLIKNSISVYGREISEHLGRVGK